MTGYFDDAAALARHGPTAEPACFLARLGEVEADVTRDVLLCSGDREFPGDLREKVMDALAVYATAGPVKLEGFYQRARDDALSSRMSYLIEELHSIFHTLAGRRVSARFGVWSDSPAGNLMRRAEWERENLKDFAS